jgi:hypothetical protein
MTSDALVRLKSLGSNVTTETVRDLPFDLRSQNQTFELGLNRCADGDLALSTEAGPMRYDASSESFQRWGLESRQSVQQIFGSSSATRTLQYVKFAESMPFGFSRLQNVADPQQLMGEEGTAYAGVQTEPDSRLGFRGDLYRFDGESGWNRLLYDTQSTTCFEGATCDPDRGDPLTTNVPTSLAKSPSSHFAGFSGGAAISSQGTVTLGGGGIVKSGSPNPQPYIDGLPLRRCQGSESVDKENASSLCPPSVKDLTYSDRLWAATGDPFTDTFEVYSRASGDSSWTLTHAGLPAEFQDSMPLHEDTGEQRTKANFAIADSTLFIHVRRMPEDSTDIYWFDEGTKRWWPMPTDGLQSETVFEIEGSSEVLLAGTKDGLYAWSDSNETWTRIGTDFPDADATDFHIASTTKIVASTDGRGVWHLDL